MNCNIYLSSQNTKLKNVNIFNLPVGLTCKKNLKCYTYCYACKAERLYKQVRPARMKNLKESKKISFVSNMIQLLKTKKYKVTRIHESGDFYSKEYINKWYKIAQELPDHILYAYTKRTDLFNKKLLNQKPKNLKLIYSDDKIYKDDEIVNINKPGYDKVAIVREHKTNCPSSSKDGWKVSCIRDCKICINNTYKVIEFAKH